MGTNWRSNLGMIARPWTFKIEFSKGCNLKCKFCPVYARPDLQDPEQRLYMEPKLLEIIARQLNEINPEGRIELTMRGEPTLNPHLLANLEVLRFWMPRIQISMFTNGVKFITGGSELMLDILRAGVNILNVDCYNGTYDRFSVLAKDAASRAASIKVTDFREFSAYKRYAHGHEMHVINLVPDIADEAHLVGVRVIHNNAGNVDPAMAKKFGVKPLTAPLKKNCARPYREMVIGWNGEVLICCHDWGNETVMGKMPEETAREIWWGNTHLAILRDLWRKDRSGAPCNKCDYAGGYRLGLLQDPTREKVLEG